MIQFRVSASAAKSIVPPAVTTVMFTSMWMNGSMSLKRPAKTS